MLTIVVIWLAFSVHVFRLRTVRMLALGSVSLLFANGSHEPISFASSLCDTRCHTVSFHGRVRTIVIRSRLRSRILMIETRMLGRRGRRTAAIFNVPVVILELFPLALPDAGFGGRPMRQRGLRRIRMRVISSHRSVEIDADA